MPRNDQALPGIAREHRRARLFCLTAWMGAFSILAAGVVIAVRTGQLEYFNRSGGLITVVSLLLLIGQFNFERRQSQRDVVAAALAERFAEQRQYPREFRDDLSRRRSAFTEARSDDTRYWILMSNVGVGALGELVHSLGDIVLENALRLLGHAS